ncbi:MAG: acylphosphatase [Ectothiorhodospiraceae bacterium]|nr:acylphosphatase [Ectothiorhodospiraceae bacterium]
MTERCMRCVVEGRVQGVWFRAGAREEALRLGVRGYARNLPDGRVEVLACGSEQALETLRDWLRTGTPQARVERLQCEWQPYAPPGDGFETG